MLELLQTIKMSQQKKEIVKETSFKNKTPLPRVEDYSVSESDSRVWIINILFLGKIPFLIVQVYKHCKNIVF